MLNFTIISAIIAMTVCFNRTATANLNHATNMNEAIKTILFSKQKVNITDSDIARFLSGIEKLGNEGGCWIWIGHCEPMGYGVFNLKGLPCRAHRFSWFLENAQDPGPLSVLHRCDVRCCVRPDHLFLGTHKENMQDMVQKGRQMKGDHHYARTRPQVLARGDRNGSRVHPERLKRGEAHGMSKLNNNDVLKIRAIYMSGEMGSHRIAKRFGMSTPTIKEIVSGKIWRQILTPEYTSFLEERNKKKNGINTLENYS